MSEPVAPSTAPAGTWRFRPLHGVLLVVVLFAVVLATQFVWEGGLTRPKYLTAPRVAQGVMQLDVADLGRSSVRFYSYLSPANQEVRFLVARDSAGEIQTAFDAAESDFKLRRGFRQEGDWIVNNKCGTSCKLADIATGGGCRPIPFAHRVAGNTLVLAENDLLAGWRYFR